MVKLYSEYEESKKNLRKSGIVFIIIAPYARQPRWKVRPTSWRDQPRRDRIAIPDGWLVAGMESVLCKTKPSWGPGPHNGSKAGTPGNPGHTWEGLPQPHQENPRIFPESRTLKGASLHPLGERQCEEWIPYQPGQTLQDSTFLSSLTAGFCLIWAWLS